MLQITCPFCGVRNESEFLHGGVAKPPRPDNPGELSEDEWIYRLIVSDNPTGPLKEKWWHVRGCGQWVTIVRDTLTHEIANEGTDCDGE